MEYIINLFEFLLGLYNQVISYFVQLGFKEPIVIGFLIFSLTAIKIFFDFVYKHISNRIDNKFKIIKENLINDPNSRKKYLEEFKNRKYTQIYQIKLRKISNWLDNFFGKTWSLKSFNKHLNIAFIYPIFLFIVIWLITKNGKIGSLILLEDSNVYTQFMILLILSEILYIAFSLNTNSKYYLCSICSSLWILGAFSFIFIILSLFFLIGNAIVVGVVFIFLFKYKKGVLDIIQGLLLTLFIWQLTTSFLLKSLNSVFVTYLYFLVLLPLINAIFDFISTSISRTMIKKLIHDQRVWLVIFHLFIDVILALISFIGLLWVLPQATAIVNYFISDEKSYIDINSKIEAFYLNPCSSDGLWILMMLFTTLLPTFVHFIAGIFALFSERLNRENYKNLVLILEKDEDIAHYDYDKVAKHMAWKDTISWFLSVFVMILIVIALLLVTNIC